MPPSEAVSCDVFLDIAQCEPTKEVSLPQRALPFNLLSNAWPHSKRERRTGFATSRSLRLDLRLSTLLATYFELFLVPPPTLPFPRPLAPTSLKIRHPLLQKLHKNVSAYALDQELAALHKIVRHLRVKTYIRSLEICPCWGIWSTPGLETTIFHIGPVSYTHLTLPTIYSV